MIYVALGANLPSQYGTPANTLMAAIDVLKSRNINIVQLSRIWLTAPVPISDQPWYHNAVIAIETDLSPVNLLKELLSIEHEFGRVRVTQNEARVLDLDIISFHDEIIHQDKLTIPHPRMHERGFVLYPLQDIAPEWIHPLLGQSISDLIASLSPDQKAQVMENAA